MNIPISSHYFWTGEAAACAAPIAPGTVSEAQQIKGMLGCEPLVVCMDAMVHYAKAYEARFEAKLCDDYVLGPQFLSAIQGLRGLLNGDGAIAMARMRGDTKDNGWCEAMFWRAMDASGFKEENL